MTHENKLPPNCTTQVLHIKCNLLLDRPDTLILNSWWVHKLSPSFAYLMRCYSPPRPMPGHHQEHHSLVCVCVFQYILAFARVCCLFTPNLQSAAILEDRRFLNQEAPGSSSGYPQDGHYYLYSLYLWAHKQEHLHPHPLLIEASTPIKHIVHPI